MSTPTPPTTTSPKPHDFRAYMLSPDVVNLLINIPMSERPRVYARLTGDDGDGCPVVCSAPGCTNAVIPLALSHSAYLEHRVTRGVAAARCSHQLADSGQHFACSLEHLRAAILECWDHHHLPRVHATLAQQSLHASHAVHASQAAPPTPTPTGGPDDAA